MIVLYLKAFSALSNWLHLPPPSKAVEQEAIDLMETYGDRAYRIADKVATVARQRSAPSASRFYGGSVGDRRQRRDGGRPDMGQAKEPIAI